MTPILIALLVVCLSISALLSGSETAFFSLSSMKVRAFRQSKDPRGRIVARMVSNPRDLLVTILILNIFMNVLLQNIVSTLFGAFSGWLWTVGVPLVLTLFFGEMIPKSIALSNNAKLAIKVARIIEWVEKAIAPIRKVVIPLTGFVSRVCFFFLKYGAKSTPEELKIALKQSREFGFLTVDESKLLRGYLNLEDDVVKEIMTPREDILYYNIHDPLEKLKDIFVERECSRVPVCDGNLETLLGVILAIDYFLHEERIDKGSDLVRYLQKPTYLPETTLAKQALGILFEREEKMAVVVDEYGSIAGLLTPEDLFESVVGQITDKRDEEASYTRSGDDVVIANGKFELNEFEEIFDVHLESPNNMATLGGWLTEMIGDIPKEGDKYVTDEFLFHILSSDETRVKRIYIRRLKSPSRRKG